MTIPTTMVSINSATIMKKLFNFVALAAIAATASVSCQKEMAAPEQPEITENKEVQIKVTAVPQALAGAETRTYINSSNTILWGTGEYMKLAVNTTFATSTDASADSFNGLSQATFSFSITPGQANKYIYMGLYPASAAGASPNTDPTSYKVNLPKIQNATATSYDPAAYIMVAKPQEFTSVQDEWMASYRRATALNKITLKNLPSGISIKRVVITAPNKKLAGGRHIDLTSGESSDIYSNENTIEVKYDSTPLSGTNVDVWFTSWDVEVAAGETLTIVAYTSDNKSYTKTIEVPSGKSIKFQEGYLNTLGANFSGITPDGVTVLAAGNYVVLAKDGSDYYALKAQKEDGKQRLLSESYSGNLTSYIGESDIIWTITKSGDSYIFENGGKYLGYKGSSNDSFWLMPDEAEGTWTGTNYLLDVTAQETDGQFYVTVHSNSRYLSKNSSGAFFAFYANTSQKADIVFVPATVMEQVATPTFDPAEGEVSSGTEITISSATNGATIYYTTDGSDPTTSSTQGNTVTITSATTLKAIAVKDGMTNSEVATALYTIAGVINYPTLETSNVELTTDGTSVSSVTVNGEDALKAGTAKVAGAVEISVPANTTKLHLHAVGWNGESVQLSITGATASPNTLSLTSNSAISGSDSSFSLDQVSNYYFCVSLSGITTETTLTFTATNGNRFVIWGVNSEATVDDRQDAGMSWSSATANATITDDGVEFTAPELTLDNAHDVTYSSTDETVATISAAGVVTVKAEGTTTIRAIFAGDDDYKPATEEYTLTVTDNRTPTSTTESITSGTFTSANSKLTLTTSSGITIEQSKVSGSTAVNASYNTVSTLRVYKGHALTFSGKTFKRIEIKVDGTNYGNSLTANTGTLTPTTTSGGTIVWEGESDSVVITNNATSSNTQLRTKSFSVTY